MPPIHKAATAKSRKKAQHNPQRPAVSTTSTRTWIKACVQRDPRSWNSTIHGLQNGQYPAELYSRLDVSTNYKYDPTIPSVGVDLGRLSNLAWDDSKGSLTTDPTNAANKIKRSPVWRMIVVNEWPDAKRLDGSDAMPENHDDLEFPHPGL